MDYSPHPALSKGEGCKKSEVKVLSFGEDYSYYNLFFNGIHEGFTV